ncbi:hypothetical protein FOXG_00805, partial [Fusarium oxysporum f. sp. lycopersici 4287]
PLVCTREKHINTPIPSSNYIPLSLVSSLACRAEHRGHRMLYGTKLSSVDSLPGCRGDKN